ncbi:hypothetical protein B0J13DRAFT_645800 [Dactylonectria estremocensis]|uniref:Zn(2)-C6 fungal-type domain-containing protein n=1 Tax=Dactylonectria estremocensis TaxID=1079267 RepID=A0A9P9IPH1_9HYPO|nr:hypothetical protein B0J13DRAFT_645800 [Dactylonectria estremocensis]
MAPSPRYATVTDLSAMESPSRAESQRIASLLLPSERNNCKRPCNPRSRTRVARACNECRRRRGRCDGVTPRCKPCSRSDRPCEWEPRQRKRGLLTGYVRALEDLIGLLLQSCKHGEELALGWLRGESVVALVQDGDSVSTSAADLLGDHWRQSETFAYLESILETPTRDFETHPPVAGIPANFESRSVVARRVSLSCHHLPDPSQVSTITETSPYHDNDQIIDCPSWMEPPVTDVIVRHQSLPSNWAYLIDLYFSNTHSYFPILDKKVILQSATVLASEQSVGNVNVLCPGDRASLLAVLALASYQEALRTSSRGDAGSRLATSTSSSLKEEAFAIATNSQPSFRLGHPQALVILALLEMTSGALDIAWKLVKQASRGLAIGHLNGNLQQPSLDTDHKLLIRGAFVLETLIAFSIGGRPSLHSRDLLCTGGMQANQAGEERLPDPTMTEDPSSEIRRATDISSAFTYLVGLFCILNGLLHAPNHLQDRDRKAFQDLRTWFTTLPPDYQSTTIAARSQTSSSRRPELLNLSICSTTVYLMLHVRTMASEQAHYGPPMQFPAIYSELPALLGRVQELGLVSLYPMIDTSIFLLGEGSLLLGEVDGERQEVLQTVVDSLNGLSASWKALRSAQHPQDAVGPRAVDRKERTDSGTDDFVKDSLD